MDRPNAWTKDTFCSYCGRAFDDELNGRWPKLCGGCSNTTYRNPLPVALLMVPVDQGLVFVRRSIPPAIGKLAFPGGYVNYGERWQDAAVREFFEETQIPLDSENVREFKVVSAPDSTVLIFGLGPRIDRRRLAVFQPNSEVSECLVIRELKDIAFPIHAEVADFYFRNVLVANMNSG